MIAAMPAGIKFMDPYMSVTCPFPSPRAKPSSFVAQILPQRLGFSGYRVHMCGGRRNGLKPTPRRRRLLLASLANESGPEEEPSHEPPEKMGTILGAVSLIVGTSIGSGILLLPQKTAPAGLIPSAISIIVCWAFLVIEALLLAEINCHLWKNRKKVETEGGDLDVISLRTMAHVTLGEWGGNIATLTYLLLAYTSMVAYTSKSGEVLSHLMSIPASIAGNLFTLLVALLLLVGGTHVTDKVNQWLTISMIGLLVTIEAIALFLGGWPCSVATSDWGRVPMAIPVIIFSLVYHDVAPVICAYLGGDLVRIRLSIMLGSIVPLISLLVWDDIVLSSNLDGVHPLDLLLRWNSMPTIIEAFSLLAVGTSLIGTLLGFSQFFVEQLVNIFNASPSTQVQEKVEGSFVNSDTKEVARYGKTAKWWRINKLSVLGISLTVIPSLLISMVVPDAFSAATDIAGGYCMAILYGMLPPAMAWAVGSKLYERVEDNEAEELAQSYGQWTLSDAKPVLLWVGLFSCGIVMEQVAHDLILLQP